MQSLSLPKHSLRTQHQLRYCSASRTPTSITHGGVFPDFPGGWAKGAADDSAPLESPRDLVAWQQRRRWVQDRGDGIRAGRLCGGQRRRECKVACLQDIALTAEAGDGCWGSLALAVLLLFRTSPFT